MHQVTIYATITGRTPHALAALIHDSEPPTPASSDFAYTPIAGQILTTNLIL